MNKLPALLLGAALLVASACGDKKNDDTPAKTDPAATDPAATDPAKAEPAAEPTEAERAAEALEDAKAKAATEAARWTDELEAKAVALRDQKFESTEAALKAIVDAEHRVPGHADRNPHRHPVETLTFFGIAPDQTVVELGAGGGWYTEILAPLLVREGKLIVMSRDPEGPADSMATVYGQRLKMFLDKSPGLYGDIQVQIIDPENLDLGVEGEADLALAMREMHGWHNRGEMDAWLKAVHAALKDGGTFGVVQHRAAEGADPAESSKKGYLPEAWVIEQVTAAGFELVEKSEINANPKDTKDYADGVWTLPPSYRLGDTDRAKYEAIGESDRMTLKFKKVAKAE